MSYDLYLYKQKNQNTSSDKIEEYFLNNNEIASNDEDGITHHDKNTGVYYSLLKEDIGEKVEIYNLENFDYTGYLFNINFIRPNFFGLEGFNSLDNLIEKFDLYVFDSTEPNENSIYKPERGELYKRWSAINNIFSKKEEFAKTLFYYPLDKSNKVWEYNKNVKKWQKELDKIGDYFVPSIFFYNKKTGGKIFTVTTWTQHIPTVIPPVDFIIINKTIKKFIWKKNVTGVISHDSLMNKLGSHFQSFKDLGGKIIDEKESAIITEEFNKLDFEAEVQNFQGIGVEYITNSL